MELWFLCKRKWAGVYIHGWRGPEGKGAALGTAVHNHKEKYLRDGTPIDQTDVAGEIASEGLHLLPAPKSPNLFVEEEFAFQAPGAWFTGKKDYVVRDHRVIIGDHKTTGDKRWIKTEEEILLHPQGIIYPTDEFRRDDTLLNIELHWTYHTTRKPYRAYPIWQTVGRNQIEDLFFGHVLPEAQQIELTRSVEDPPHMLEFPPSPSACDAFGGCHLQNVCNLSPQDRIRGIMAQGSLLAKIRGQGTPNNGAAPAPNPFTPPPTQAPQAAPGTPPPGWDAAFQPGAQPNANTAPQAWSPPQPQVAPAPQPWTPPQQTTPLPEYQYQNAPPQQPQGGPPVAPQQPWTPPPRVEAAPQEGKQKRKYTKKKSAEVIDGSVPQQEAGEEQDGFTLYIGCLPIGCEYVSAIDYADAANELVSGENNVPTYGAIEYGRGPALLQHALARVLDSNDPITGDVVLMGTPIERDVQNVFRSRAAKIVMAVYT